MSLLLRINRADLGVLAPNAKLRAEIIPYSGRQAGNVPVPGLSERADQRQYLLSGPRSAPSLGACPYEAFAQLLKRVFEIDMEHCSHCGGTLKLIASIEHPPVIANIRTHLGLPARAPRAPARAFDRLQCLDPTPTHASIRFSP